MGSRRKPDHAANARHIAAYHARQKAQRIAAANRRDALTQSGPVTITRTDGSVDTLPALTVGELRRVAPERLVIADALRQRVLARDGGTCRYCGAEGPFEMDHVVPVAHGGRTSFSNLVTACVPCNRRKGTDRWTPKPLQRCP